MNVSEPNIQHARQLLDQIIEKNEFDDKFLKATNRDLTGESWNVFHLKALRDLLNQIFLDEKEVNPKQN